MKSLKLILGIACIFSGLIAESAPFPSPQFGGLLVGQRGSVFVFNQAFGFRVSHDGGKSWRDTKFPYDATEFGPNDSSYSFRRLEHGDGAQEDWPEPSDGITNTREPHRYSCVGSRSLRANIYLKAKSGAKWELVSTLPGEAQFCIGLEEIGNTVIVATRSGLFRSTDRGRTWNRISQKGTLADSEITSLIADRQDRLFAITRKGNGDAVLFVSVDQGVNWRRATLPGKSAQLLMAAKLIASVGKRIFVSSAAGLQYSEDAGHSWHRFDEGLDYHARVEQNSEWEIISELVGTPDGTLLASSRHALYRRAASDRRWQRVPLQPTDWPANK